MCIAKIAVTGPAGSKLFSVAGSNNSLATLSGGSAIAAKKNDMKFPAIESLSKFAIRKASINTASNDCNGKDGKLFKFEYDDGRQPPPKQQLFRNFYEKVQDINSSLAFNNSSSHADGGNSGGTDGSGSGGGVDSNMYYDDYDSYSNSDEEISVT